MIASLIILLLLVGNGVFAMTEIALVSARRGRLRQMADEGSAGAAKALKLLENPERFLSSVQIGITLVGVLSGAFGTVALAGDLQAWIARIPVLAEYASQISFALVVTVVTYLSLIIGELVPKGIALRHAETISAVMSRPMDLLSRAAGPLVSLLELSTRLILRLLGDSSKTQSGPTREEVQVLVREGMITGMVDQQESSMVEGVFDLREVLAEEMMRPKPKVVLLAGFIVHRLDRLPDEGESFTAGSYAFEVVDMDRQRIDKVMIRRLPAAEDRAGDMAGAV